MKYHPCGERGLSVTRSSEYGLEKPIGAVVRAGETPEKYFNMGVKIVLISAYLLLASAAKMFIKSCQE